MSRPFETFCAANFPPWYGVGCERFTCIFSVLSSASLLTSPTPRKITSCAKNRLCNWTAIAAQCCHNKFQYFQNTVVSPTKSNSLRIDSFVFSKPPFTPYFAFSPAPVTGSAAPILSPRSQVAVHAASQCVFHAWGAAFLFEWRIRLPLRSKMLAE